MTEDEAATFETIMLSEPTVAADVDFRHRVKAGLERLEASGELAPILAGAGPRRIFTFAAAASALLAVMAATWVLTRPVAVATADRGASQSFMLVSTRSGDTPVLTINAGMESVVLRVPVDADQATYLAHIEPAVNGTMPPEAKAFDRTAAPAGDGTVEVTLKADELSPGIYTLQLSGSDGTSQTLPFEVSKSR
jgi:hypothetical protein